MNAIAAGSEHTCALISSGAAQCWGWNGNGQLGDGSVTDRTTPVDVNGLGSGVSAIAAGGTHTCSLSNSGTAKCWGNNEIGQLGDASTTDRTTPVAVSLNTSGGSTGGGGGCTIKRNAGFDWSFVVMLLLGVGTRVLRRNGKMAGEARPA